MHAEIAFWLMRSTSFAFVYLHATAACSNMIGQIVLGLQTHTRTLPKSAVMYRYLFIEKQRQCLIGLICY